MNEKKFEQLFRAARAEPAPAPAQDFEARVMRTVHRQLAGQEASMLEQLSAMLPRLAAGAAVVIALCLATDLCLSSFVQPDLSAGLNQLAEQWLFAAK